MMSTNRTSSSWRVEEQMVMRDTLRETGDEDREDEEEEEEEEREVKEHLLIVSEIGEEGEEDDDDARMNVEHGGGISLTNTTSTSSILLSPPLTLTTPLFSPRDVSSVSLLIFTFTLCSFSFSPDVDGVSLDVVVPLLLISVEMSVISTSPLISITPVGSMMTFSGSDRCDAEVEREEEISNGSDEEDEEEEEDCSDDDELE